MFTEELRGNANKKKQEQARARRRKLKELQLKKQKEQNEQKKSGNQSFPSKNLDNVKVDSTEVSVVETMSSSSDAVTKALEQRKVRSLQKLHNRSALIIQSVFRSYVHVQKLKQNERTTLVRRLSDLKTLTDILKNQEKPTYIPPTSLAISMLNQVFFLTHTTPRYQHMTTNDVNNQAGNSSKPLVYFSKVKHLDAEDIAILSQILEIVLLPGIIGDDIHLDTTMLWLESKEGKLKMKKLLRLICNSLLSQKNPNSRVEGFTATGNEVSAIDQFLRILIGISSPQPQNKKVVPYCKELLLSQKYDLTILQPGGNNIGAHPIQEDCLDLIHMLRSLILYPQQKVCIVIPQNAEEARENCILKADKERADIVFRLVLDGVIRYKIPILTSRFFSEIISIPLLSWRIEGTTVNLLLRKDSSCEEDGSKFSYLLDTFLIQFSQALSPGSLPDSLSKVLPVTDVPMKLCPASSILCLFANIVQFGILCPSLNGTNPINDGTKYFNFLARLVDLIPIGTFCSRQSSVEWISDGSKLTPVVLSPVILDQCKLIFLDSFVRNVFHYAIDTTGVQVDKVINNKDKRDEKLENDFKQIFSESLASVAAKEAMIDRSKGFLKSKWAKTLSKKIVSHLLLMSIPYLEMKFNQQHLFLIHT
jgi:ubiquitin-protein ligase E3 C